MVRTVLLASIGLLLASCLPAEVQRSRQGALAWRLEHGIAVQPPGDAPRQEFTITHEGSEEVQPVLLRWSPDDRLVAFTMMRDEKFERQSVGVLDPKTGKTRILADHDEWICWLRWSPDSKQVSYVLVGSGEAQDGKVVTELRIVPVAGGESRVLAGNCGTDHVWTPDGTAIATVLTRVHRLKDSETLMGAIAFVDVESKEIEEKARVVFDSCMRLRFSLDGKRLLFSGRRLTLPAPPGRPGDLPRALFSLDVGSNRVKPVGPWGEGVSLSLPSPSGRRTLLVVPEDSSDQLGGKIYIAGPGIEGRRSVAECTEKLIPFWLDEDRIGYSAKTDAGDRILLYDVRDGSVTDATDRFPGIGL